MGEPPPTPPEFLMWTKDGNVHAHSHQEANAGLWRDGAGCQDCPWRVAWAEAEEVTPVTQVIRRREGT